MWERKYERGRWNGFELNILSTSLEGGTHVQVSDIPFSELPRVKVMGSLAVSVAIDVVFVGKHSLVDAGALIENLLASPKGELEHPWLGELPLVFKGYSQKIDTKLGVVTLSLTFVKDGKSATLIAVDDTSSVQEQLTDEVEKESTKTFVRDVEEMDIPQVTSLRESFTHMLNQLSSIANKLSIPGELLTSLNQEINRAMMSISSILNAPAQFAEQISATIDSIADAIKFDGDSDEQADNSSSSNSNNNSDSSVDNSADNSSNKQAVDNSRSAQSMMLDMIDDECPSSHFNTQLVVASVKMSNDMAMLERSADYDITQSDGQSSIILTDLARITTEIGRCISAVTRVSTLESVALFDTLVALDNGVSAQAEKVKRGRAVQFTVHCSRYVPSLVLAQQGKSTNALVTALNSHHHPLFLKGDVKMRLRE